MMPVDDEATLIKMNQQCAMEVHAKSAYCLYDGENPEGFILYNVTHDYGEILAVQADDDTYVDGLVRTVLGSLYDIGIDKVHFGEKVDTNLLEKLELLKAGQKEIASVTRLINACSGCRGCRGCF